jgi:PIF1-like helicase
VVLDTIHNFLHCDDLRQFKPLRIIVNGQGGSGKSVVINTLVTIIRKMFGFNDVVRVIAPTGVAAYNVNGETFHHLFHMGVSGKEYRSNTMSQFTRTKLIQKFKTTLALIIDERSLVSSRLLGTAESMASETMHGGCYHQDESWGGVPVVIMVGDDYQLPGIGEGAFTALYNRYGSKMTYKGRRCLLECADFVMQLGASKRVSGSQAKTRALLDRLRIGTGVLEEDVTKLMSLHLDNVRMSLGDQVVEEIEDRAMFLFFKNQKRIEHNMKQLLRKSSKTNPVAVIKSRTNGRTNAKGIRSHFDADLPSASIFCEGSKVAINSRNFKPSWGLHNGACGTAIEIIFAKGGSPNNGDMPLYTVVDFPLYCGPIWDKDHPTVRSFV